MDMEREGKLIPKDQRILRAAEYVFSKKGYRQATLDEIVKIADTGKGTVYKYYKNKETLFYTLVNGKNKEFVKALQEAYDSHDDFKGKFLAYFDVLTNFLNDNIILWSVLLLEIMSPQAGWQMRWNEETNDYDVITKFGKKPTRAEIETKRHYMEIIRSEVTLLTQIFRFGIETHYLKPVNDISRISGNIYFSFTMTIIQGFLTRENKDRAISMFLDRFLYGHIADEYK
jgi:AcrR family transcriptional regulator